jgi:hypothetical protein
MPELLLTLVVQLGILLLLEPLLVLWRTSGFGKGRGGRESDIVIGMATIVTASVRESEKGSVRGIEIEISFACLCIMARVFCPRSPRIHMASQPTRLSLVLPQAGVPHRNRWAKAVKQARTLITTTITTIMYYTTTIRIDNPSPELALLLLILVQDPQAILIPLRVLVPER